MVFSKSIIIFLTFGLILNFVAEETSGQHLRWGKRDEMEADNPAAFINKGRWAGEINDLESNFLRMWRRAYLAGKNSNERQKDN